jgi:hypothetical protein
VKDDADKNLKEWEEGIKARELAEKRRVAPGWLDSDARILEPEKKADDYKDEDIMKAAQSNLMDMDASSAEAPGLRNVPAQAGTGGGDELDRAFGGMGLS